MKKNRIVGVALCLLLLVGCNRVSTTGLHEKPPQDPHSVEITFDFAAQSGAGTNQMAVWMQDMEGNYIKTLFVTNYAGRGGYAVRTIVLPQWAQSSGAKEMKPKVVDGITGATPKSGSQTWGWDCTSQEHGTQVPDGQYRYFVEANLAMESRVIYSGTIDIGEDDNESQGTPDYFEEKQDMPKQMIQNVRATYKSRRK